MFLKQLKNSNHLLHSHMAIHPSQKSHKYFILIGIAIIILLGIAIYSNTFDSEFVFDDIEFISTNSYIKSFANIRGFWMEGFPKTRLITLYSFALNYYLHQLDVTGYHVTNLLIHIITTLLVWWFVLMLFKTETIKDKKIAEQKHLISFFCSLLFLVHPVQTQAISYITQRFASLTAMFYIASVCFFLKGILLNKKKIIRRVLLFIGSTLFALLALMSKEIAITLPLMLFFIYMFLVKRYFSAKEKRNIFIIIVASLTGFIIIYNIFFPGKFLPTIFGPRASESHIGDTITFWNYQLTQSRVWATFVRLLFIPISLNLDYDFPVSNSFFEAPVIFSFLLIIALFYLGIKLRRDHRLISFGIFWFFLTLSANLVPRVNVIFEHKLYLVSIGFCIAFCVGLYKLLENKKVFITVLSILLCIFSILTYQRNKVWQTELSLWQDVIKKSPNKGRPHQNLGKVYINMGEFRKGVEHLNKALEADPQDYRAYTNRGAAHYHLGNYDQALSDLTKAIEIRPKFFGAYSNRGLVYGRLGKIDLALADFNKAIEIKPNFRLGYANRADLHSETGKLDLALNDYSIALKLEPMQVDTYNRRAITLFKLGKFDHALTDFNQAVRINPNSSQTYANRGYLYLQRGTYDLALQDLNRAIQLNPNAFEAYNNRGSVFLKLNKFDLALHDFDIVLKIMPNHSSALYNIGAVHMLKGDLNQAIFFLNKSININPNYAPAYWLRANCYEKKNEFGNALNNALKAKSLNYAVDEEYIEKLKKLDKLGSDANL